MAFLHPGAATAPARLAYLDGWRGVSILMVLVGHFCGYVLIGLFGVYLFFALSGRLMAQVLFVERMPLGEFYRRRLSRVYPAMLVFVLITCIAVRDTHMALDLRSMAEALTFTLNYEVAFRQVALPVQNLWSLCVEEHSYVLLGLIALACRVRRANPTVALACVGVASLADGLICLVLLHQPARNVFWRSDSQLAPIFLSAASYLALRGRPSAGWLPLAGLVAALAAIFAPTPVAYLVIPASLAVAVATLENAPDVVRSALAWPPLTTLGVGSYSIYLWQHPFYRLMIDKALPWWGALAATLVAAGASFYLVERPARRWLNGLGSPKPQRVPYIRSPASPMPGMM